MDAVYHRSMPLSDRLQRARTQRLIEAGVLPSEFALKPEAEIEPEPVEEAAQGLFAPITIEVQPTGLHLVSAAPSEMTEVLPGASGEPVEAESSCPNCQAVGRIDIVDLVGHTIHLTCENCGTMWLVRQPVGEIVR
jgi:hypothetical protein